MAIKLDPKKLKDDLIEVWSKYVENPDDKKNREISRKLYTLYIEAAAGVLPKEMVKSVTALVDIAYSTGIKIKKKDAMEILERLKKWKQ
jgi:hypothetical protein